MEVATFIPVQDKLRKSVENAASKTAILAWKENV